MPGVKPGIARFLPFLAWRRRVDAGSLRADAAAGAIGALVVLPQGVAFATLAGLPPEYGLYCAIVPAIVAALFGSSWHLVSGPTNALSLVVFATVAPLAVPRSDEYIVLVLTLTLMVGLMQLAMGVARLGALVNFISHTVIVGFTAGAALLIFASQVPHFFGVPGSRGANFFESLHHFAGNVASIDVPITATAIVTLGVAIVARQTLRRVPYMIVAMVAGSAFAYVLAQSGFADVPTAGALPAGLPRLSLPSLDPDVWSKLVPAALALTLLGLTEAVSIARAIAQKSGQRIDGSQEFVGQGLSNIAGAFTSAYPSSGSFNRSGLNYESGARTPLASVIASLVLLAILFAVAPLGAYLPLSVMAAVLFVVAWNLIDIAEIRRIARTSRSELFVLCVTFVATLATALEFAIFVGVLASLLVYLNRTTHPSLTRVAPDARTPQRRFAAVGPASRTCPQTRHPAPRRLALLRRGRARARRARGRAPATSRSEPRPPRRKRRQLHRHRRMRGAAPGIARHARQRRNALSLQFEARCGNGDAAKRLPRRLRLRTRVADQGGRPSRAVQAARGRPVQRLHGEDLHRVPHLPA